MERAAVRREHAAGAGACTARQRPEVAADGISKCAPAHLPSKPLVGTGPLVDL